MGHHHRRTWLDHCLLALILLAALATLAAAAVVLALRVGPSPLQEEGGGGDGGGALGAALGLLFIIAAAATAAGAGARARAAEAVSGILRDEAVDASWHGALSRAAARLLGDPTTLALVLAAVTGALLAAWIVRHPARPVGSRDGGEPMTAPLLAQVLGVPESAAVGEEPPRGEGSDSGERAHQD